MSDMMKLEDIKNQVLECDCFDILKQISDNTFTAIVTDPPYGLSSIPDMREVLKHWLAGDDYEHKGVGFMGKSWDSFVPGPKTWEELMRVLKPGGHIFSFGGTRTYDMMVTAMRLAGAEVRDKLDFFCEIENSFDWVQGQGFPKSLSIDKAIDKRSGRIGQDITTIKLKLAALFDASGKSRKQIDNECGFRACNYLSYPMEDKKHDPWFGVLPSQDKWQKIKKVVGQGDLEIDTKLDEWFIQAEREIIGQQTKARKTDCGIALPTIGDTEYQTWDVTVPSTDEAKKWKGYGTALKPAHEPVAMFTKSGGDDNIIQPIIATIGCNNSAPFLYTAKVSTKERNYGCDHLFWVGDNNTMKLIDEEEHTKLKNENEKRKDEQDFVAHRLAQGNPHPTVKPIELMRYLVKMVKMPDDNLILDPFCGSGSTLCACILEGIDFVGIDSDPMAATIAATRAYYFRCLGEKGLK
jgi:DNA modification methylase